MAAGIMCCALVSAACSATPSASPAVSQAASQSTSTSQPTAVAVGGGGTLVIVSAAEPETLGINTAVSSNFNLVMRNVYQTLLARNPSTYELGPQLALSWANPDPLTWTFELRQGVTFSDGSAWNAEAAAAILTKYYDPEGDQSDFVGAAATFEATGEYSLKMTTESPDPLVASRMAMISVSSAKQLAEAPDGIGENPIGTGPYKVVKWTKGSQIDLELNKDSWMAAPGMYDKVTWLFRKEPSVRSQMIQTGEADVTNNLQADQCSAITCTPQLAPRIWFIRIDQFKQDLLGDTRVRQAIAMAIDRAGITDSFLLDAPVNDNPVPQGSVGFDPNIAGYKFDMDAAKALLAQAAADGVDTSLPVKVRYFTKDNPSIAEVIADNLKTLGLTVSIESGEDADRAQIYAWRNGRTLEKDMVQNRGEIWFAGSGNEMLDQSFIDNIYLRCNGDSSVFCDPAIDAKLDAALPLSGAERQAAFVQLWRAAYDQVAFLPISQSTNLWALSDKVSFTTQQDNIIPLWLARPK